ncbi:MAG TPA: hypothetical protein VFP72_08155 [Kineosporiaceae bacterium]|nr:hypothetical protein [Kineosporiaceae bacterium]
MRRWFPWLGAGALALGSVLPAGPATAATRTGPPACPHEVGDFALVENNLEPHGSGSPWDVLSCTYRSADFSAGAGTQVQFTVSWQVVESRAVAVIGAAPCSGKVATQRLGGALSVAAGDRQVGSYAVAGRVEAGRSTDTPVPEEFAPVLTDLVAAAGPLALPCDGGAASPTRRAAQTPAAAPSSAPAPASGGTGLTFEYEVLIAAGLIMMLLAGGVRSLPGILRHLRSRRAPSIDRVTNDILVAASGGRPDPLPVPGPPPGPAAGPLATPPAAGEFHPITGPLPPPGGPPPPAGPPPVPVPPAPQPTVTTAQVDGLENTFAATVGQRLTEGYWVRNPSLVAKVWNTFTHPWRGSHSGQCGEFADNGVRWMGEYVHDQFGPGAVVDTVYMARRSVFVPNPDLPDQIDAALPMNHAATRVILPDGRRFVMDFWEAMGRSQGAPPKLVPEDVWAVRWAGQIPEAQLSRTADELALREQVLTVGEDRAFASFRQAAARTGQSAQAETLIRSWSLNPW